MTCPHLLYCFRVRKTNSEHSMVHPLFLQYMGEMNHFLGGVCVIWSTVCVDFAMVSKVIVFLIFIFIYSQKEQLQKQQQHQLISNGKSPERSESPNSTSTATSAGTVTPPSGKFTFWLAMHTLNRIQKPQELIYCHICIHKPWAYIVPVVCL